jgi:hypothetical protein
VKNVTTERGFQIVTHEIYVADPPEDGRLVQASSAIGDYEDSFDRPGSSFLWVGRDHHLNREEVAELVARLSHWLSTGRLFEPDATEGGK